MTDEQAPHGQDHHTEIADSQGVQSGTGNIQLNLYPDGGWLKPPAALTVGDIPWEAPSFQPRATVMEALEPRTDGPGNHPVFAVTGHLGTGKTQVAASYARRRMDEQWRLVAWVDASDETALLSGLAQVARDTKIADGESRAEVLARKVKNLLQTDGDRRLLVFDNATDLDLLRPYLPVAGRAQVIVTSTRSAATDLGIPVPVDEFTEEEALAFLADRTGLADAPGALAVAEELGFLPLGLAQAAALIKQERLSDYQVYLERLREIPVARYLREVEGDPYPRRVADAIGLSLQAVEARDPEGLCGRLTGLISVLADTGTSRQVLHHAAGTGAFGDDVTWTKAEVDDRLGRLGAASLVGFAGKDHDLVAAHRLVMRVVRDRHAEAGDLAAVTDGAVQALTATAFTIGNAWENPPGVRDLATQTSAIMDRRKQHRDAFAGTGDIPEDLLRLRLRSARLLNELGESPDLVITATESLVADYERVMGADHRDALGAQSNLAWAYQNAGRAADAIPVLTRALPGFTAVLGPDHRDTLTARNDLATAYQETGHSAQAIPLHRQVLADRQRVLGPDHRETLGSRNNLAVAYQKAEQLEDAILLFEEALSDYERVMGADHPDTLTVRNNFGVACRAAGDTGRAIPLLKQVVADSERVRGPAHPGTLEARFNLAMAYRAEGATELAISLLSEVLPEFERVLRPGHPSTETVRDSLDRLLDEQ